MEWGGEYSSEIYKSFFDIQCSVFQTDVIEVNDVDTSGDDDEPGECSTMKRFTKLQGYILCKKLILWSGRGGEGVNEI